MPEEKPVPSTESQPTPAPVAEPKPVIVPPVVETVEKTRYEAAVREMNLNQREAAQLRKDIDALKKQVQPSAQPQNAEQPIYATWTEEYKQKVASDYGKEWGDVKLVLDAMEVTSGKKTRELEKKLSKVSDLLYQGQFEQTKARYKSEDVVFKRYEPEISERLMQLTPEERLTPENIKKVRLEILDEHLPEMLAEREAAVRASITPTPVSAPSVNDVSDGGFQPSRPVQLTAAQRAVAEKYGQDPAEVEKLYQGKVTPSSWDRHFGK